MSKMIIQTEDTIRLDGLSERQYNGIVEYVKRISSMCTRGNNGYWSHYQIKREVGRGIIRICPVKGLVKLPIGIDRKIFEAILDIVQSDKKIMLEFAR